MLDITKPPTLLELIRTYNTGHEDDIAYTIAGAINLYAEARRRLHGRVLFTPNDVRAIFTMIEVLITDTKVDDPLPDSRPRELSTEESEELMTAITGRRV